MSGGEYTGDFASHRVAMDHLLGVAAALVGAKKASISLVQNDISRVIAHQGLGMGNITFRWPAESAPYAPNKTVIIQDLKDVRIARVIKSLFGEVRSGTYVRLPVIVADTYTVALVLYIPEERRPPSKSDLVILKTIAKILAGHLEVVVASLMATGSNVSIAASFDEIVSAVNHFDGFRALLNKKLEVVAISDSLAQHLAVNRSELIGKSYHDISMPLKSTMAHLYKRALETSISTPEIDAISSSSGLKRSYRFRGTPIRPVDHDEDLLDVSFTETTDPQALLNAEVAQKSLANISSEGVDATTNFLFDTLVQKRVIHSRNDMSYLTIRNWRSSIKEHQIKAFRAIKKNPHAAFAERVAQEFAREVDNLVGRNTFKFVVPVPCGHSKPGTCMAYSLAKSLGAELGLPVIGAFVHLDQKGSSHPKTNAKRPPMRLVQSVPGPALLIDDVATSGSHLEEASNRLKAEGTETFAMAWISGESA